MGSGKREEDVRDGRGEGGREEKDEDGKERIETRQEGAR